MTIDDAIKTLKQVLNKPRDEKSEEFEQVETSVKNSINLLNCVKNDVLKNPKGGDFELPNEIGQYITGIDGKSTYPIYEINFPWAAELNRRIVCGLNGDEVKRRIKWDTISKWLTFIGIVITIVILIVLCRFVGDTMVSISGTLLSVITSFVPLLLDQSRNKKFYRTYGISIKDIKRPPITDEEYKKYIKDARNLYKSQNVSERPKFFREDIREAKKIYNKLLKTRKNDPNCYVGLLAVYSKGFSKYSGKLREDYYIHKINKWKGDEKHSHLDKEYKNDYTTYTKNIVKPYQENQKQTKTKKNEQHSERVAHAILVWQKIGICAVLLLPIILSSVVLALVYCLPVKTFDDWTGWLLTIIFALDCLSVIAVIVLLIVLMVADNPDFSGFVVEPGGVWAAICGICGGTYIIASIEIPYWVLILIAVVCLAMCLACLIWGLVDTDTCKRRLLLVCICICSVLVGCALYSGGRTFSEFESYYTENPDGTYTYLVWDENVENLQIPSEYQGKPVTAISRADNVDLSHLKSVFIPESVTSIEFGAFSGCSALTNITVPYVGYYDISGVKDYEGEAETLHPLGHLFGTSPYSGGVATEQYYWGKYLSGDDAGRAEIFYNTYYIPESLKHITVLGGEVCNGAFYGCTNLESVTLGDGVTAIGEYAFRDCTSLVSVAIGEGVTGIGENAFLNCSGLTNIYIPESVTSIESGAFSGCSALTNITVPYVGYYNIAEVTDYDGEAETLRPIGHLFGASPYSGGVAIEQRYIWGKYLSGDESGEESVFSKTYYIPESLKHITVLGGEVCNGAFYGCTNLESVTLGDGVTAIGEYAFQDCTSLVSVAIGESVTTIGKDAFLNCNAVQKNKGILYVGNWVVGCDNTVTEAELSNDATGIANYAFADFASLTSVILNENLKIIGEGAFQGTGITTMVIPQSVAVIDANAFSGCTLSEVVFDNVDEWYADKTYVPYSDLLDATKAASCLTSTYVECVWKRG